MSVVEAFVVSAVGASLALHVAGIVAFVVVFRRRRRAEPALTPSPSRPAALVSVLKPLAGLDDELAENLASFGALDNTSAPVRFEIVFGVASPRDPAFEVARAFCRRHPGLEARVVVTEREAAVNPKVAQLVGLAAAARGDVLVISDSNVRVAPDYLARLVAPLADPRCGLVTSIFAGTGERTLGAALENLQLGAMTTPAVVLSAALAQPVTVGKSMAMRRADLEALGGFPAIGDLLAEDFILGRRFAEAGFSVATSFATIENRNVDGSVLRSFQRHVRWAKMRRALFPELFAFEPLLIPILVAAAGFLAIPTRATALALLVAALLQSVAAHVALRALRGHGLGWRYAPLEVARSFFVLACWAGAWASREVSWRGHAFRIGRDTRLEPALSRRRRFSRAS
jgi:ceramide glucosyltransferase